MREILFRGKRIDNGEWVFGYYIKATHHWNEKGIHEDWIATDTVQNGGWCNVRGKHAVDPTTVGQYTGLTDKNGKRIFEGDILESADFTVEDGYGVVEWNDGAYEVGNGSWCGTFHENYNGREFEVIGNIHDNPELVKEETT